jgi:hypothetical protein
MDDNSSPLNPPAKRRQNLHLSNLPPCRQVPVSDSEMGVASTVVPS